ncbi:MAG: hypothetical protein ACTSRZ_20765 [Promethearchaeota archaeon]
MTTKKNHTVATERKDAITQNAKKRKIIKGSKILRYLEQIYSLFKLISFAIIGVLILIETWNLHEFKLFLPIMIWFPTYLLILALIPFISNFKVFYISSYFYNIIALSIVFIISPLSILILIILSGDLFFLSINLKQLKNRKFKLAGKNSLKQNLKFFIFILIIIGVLSVQASGYFPPKELSISFKVNASSQGTNENNTTVSFFVEWYFTQNDIKWMFSNSALNILEQYNSLIYLLIPESNLTSNSFACNATILLNSYNITVWAWLALDEQKGYYFTDETCLSYPILLEKFHNWTVNEGLKFEGIMLDIEPNTFHRDKISDFLFGKMFNFTTHKLSEQIQLSLIDRAHELGYKIAYCGPDLYIDDILDRDDDLIQIFGLPKPVSGYEKYIIMAYRSLYPWTNKLPQNYYLYASTRNYLNLFGTSATIALATIGKGSYPCGLLNEYGIKLLCEDINLLRVLGIKETQLWCLEWLLWYGWDKYTIYLEKILSAGNGYSYEEETQINSAVISINPMYFEFRSVLIFLDLISSAKLRK